MLGGSRRKAAHTPHDTRSPPSSAPKDSASKTSNSSSHTAAASPRKSTRNSRSHQKPGTGTCNSSKEEHTRPFEHIRPPVDKLWDYRRRGGINNMQLQLIILRRSVIARLGLAGGLQISLAVPDAVLLSVQLQLC